MQTNFLVPFLQKQPAEVFSKKSVFRNFPKLIGKHLCESQVQAQAWNFIKKETQAQVFSCEFCEISKHAFFTEYVWATASKQNCFLQIIAKTNLWVIYIYFTVHLHTICTLDFCYFVTKWPKQGTNSKKPNVLFLFCRMQICRIFTKSTQTTNEKNVCGVIFGYSVIHKVRSSHQRCSVRKGVLRNFTKFTGKHLCLRPATLLK